jgi:DNA-binding MarR family transcriptional regulator
MLPSDSSTADERGLPVRTRREARGAHDPDAIHGAIRLRATVAHLGRQLRATAGPDGPGMAKLGVLGQLYRLGPMTPTRLAQLERVRLQTLTRLLAELEFERLIHRRADPADARRTQLSIAPAGARLLAADIHRRESSLASAIETRLDADERRALLAACQLLDRIGDALVSGGST